jgi:transglutaminase-like putative cysteine protease
MNARRVVPVEQPPASVLRVTLAPTVPQRARVGVCWLWVALSLLPGSAECQQTHPDPATLASTAFVDAAHPSIVATATRLVTGREGDVEKARALYEFVRDGNTGSVCSSYVASEILACGGNLCYQRAILLAALARAAGIPARLHLQKVSLKGWRGGSGAARDVVFAHGITGLYLQGRWRLLEVVGNPAKWVLWTGEPKRAVEMPLVFAAEGDTLLPSDERVTIETLPVWFADRTPEMVSLIEGMNRF